MAETIDELTIINRALARIGGGQIFDRDEDTDLARQVFAIHDDLIDAAFGLWDWSWCRRTRALDRLADVPIGYSSAFAFPAEAMAPPLALFIDPKNRDVRLRAFSVEGRQVYADTDTLYGVFPCRIDPADWPPQFRLGYTTWLASGLAVPVTHDSDLKARLEQEAIGTPSEGYRGGLMGRVIALDAAGSGGKAAIGTTDALTSAHFGSGPWDGGNSGW